ncbi:protein toll-like [Zeugodacus cucurbitae]|uniref:protein toll-like n=1 Tax=Zeugodacus cucurbitae TaxID=28588 RepID=UPI0023D96037|nr:protein toll-like [Zeugodacus cucurbitae]
MHPPNRHTYRRLVCAFKQFALIIIFSTLSQAYVTPKISAPSQIATTMKTTVSAQHQGHHTCYDARCQCSGSVLKCLMKGVTILIDSGAAVTSNARFTISCAANTTADEIHQARFPYRFQHNKAKFILENCVELPEILRRARINYTGTIKFNGAFPVPARFLSNALGLQRLRIDLAINSSAADILPMQFFHNQNTLKELRLILLCKPQAVAVPTQIFHTLYALESLMLRVYQIDVDGITNTVLRNLTAAHFRDTSNLRKLSLDGNYMQILPRDIFATLTELNELTLCLNRLEALPSGLLRAQSKLIKLDLSGNLLQMLPPGIFDTTPYLWELDLADNQFSVPTNVIAAVQPLRYLYRLNLSHNSFTRIVGAGVFNNHTLLTREQISEISEAPAYFQHYLAHLPSKRYAQQYNMTLINLSHNRITAFHLNSISAANVSCPYELDFTNNQIKHIYSLSHPHHSQGSCMRKLLLQNNPLQCDCALAWIHSVNFSLATNWECAEHSGSNHIYLFRQVAMCAWTPKFCPAACNCHYDGQALYINCTHALLESLTQLPRPMQVSLTRSTLDITHNRFFELPSNLTFGYANVTRLYAAHNRLENIQSAHLPPQLQLLDVRSNRLARLSNSFILHHLNESATLQQLYLSENPWLCDCDAEQLMYAVRAHRKRIPDVALLACANLQNTSLLKARYAEVCVPASVRRLRLLWLLFSLSLAVIVLISLLALYYKYYLELHVWLYAHNMFLCCIREYELDKEKTFDAFISYAHQDAHFVNNILLPGLEQFEPKFRVCTHERNWLAGAYIPEQIIESVAQSRRTIIVLSQHFIASDWARMEFRTAHQCALNERRARIIIIKYGELIDLTTLDKELRAYLDMNTYLEWVEHPWFWSKLRYAMPHRKGELRSAGMLELNERQRVYVIGDVELNRLRGRSD